MNTLIHHKSKSLVCSAMTKALVSISKQQEIVREKKKGVDVWFPLDGYLNYEVCTRQRPSGRKDKYYRRISDGKRFRSHIDVRVDMTLLKQKKAKKTVVPFPVVVPSPVVPPPVVEETKEKKKYNFDTEERKEHGMRFTENADHILQGMDLPKHVKVMDPFCGGDYLIRWEKPLQMPKQSQKHGFDIENSVRLVFGIAEESNNTDTHDIPKNKNTSCVSM